MFNLQGSEIIIILLLALVVLGPEKLPEAMRKAGKFYGDIRKMSSGFQEEFKAAMEEPVNEVRETANVLRDSADFKKLRDGARDEKPKSAEMVDATGAEADHNDDVDDDDEEEGLAGLPPEASAMPLVVELDDDEDDEIDIDPSTGAGEPLSPPSGSLPVDITKPAATRPPPPPPPPFSGTSTAGLGIGLGSVDDAVPDAPDAGTEDTSE